jgi:predicted unusual protein kinase regulating ubiquinone biosynthesis (AarF/ABC1/UbiB family)
VKNLVSKFAFTNGSTCKRYDPAKLKTTGEQVIVKVQRPGLKEIFDIDLKNLRVIAKWLQKVDPKTDGAARDWVAIFDETARVLYDEVDYKNEAKNAVEFGEQFKGVGWIKVGGCVQVGCS